MSYDTLDYPQSRPPKKEDDFADWSEETDLDSLDEELANLYKEIEDSVKPLEDYYQLAEETEYKERN
ncbi:MAG: hypothetical protein LBC61_04840 [Candidatus Peribacteria bacterium]|jgi:hypothetical protein|nr:hypothetical protein [Candidatus Peribacteria bacterium]